MQTPPPLPDAVLLLTLLPSMVTSERAQMPPPACLTSEVLVLNSTVLSRTAPAPLLLNSTVLSRRPTVPKSETMPPPLPLALL